jgi:hypothetical protein
MQRAKIGVPGRVRHDMGHVRENDTITMKTSYRLVAGHFRHPFEAIYAFWNARFSVTLIT